MEEDIKVIASLFMHVPRLLSAISISNNSGYFAIGYLTDSASSPMPICYSHNSEYKQNGIEMSNVCTPSASKKYLRHWAVLGRGPSKRSHPFLESVAERETELLIRTEH